MPRPTRRAVVAAAAGGLAGVLGGCSAAPSRPAGAPSRPERTSTTTAAPTATTTAAPTATPDESSVTRGSFRSSAVGREVGFRIVRPPGHGSADGAAHPLPLVLGLHGFGGDADSVLDLGVARMLAERARAGAPALAVVTVDGGRGSYYHRRADGTDAAAEDEATAELEAGSGAGGGGGRPAPASSVALVLRRRDEEVEDLLAELFPVTLRSRTRRVSDHAGFLQGRAAADRADLGLSGRLDGRVS